jgi:hypothetical protein
MSGGGRQHEKAENIRTRRRGWLVGVGTAVLVAVLTAVVTGLAERAVDAIPGEGQELISYGVEELKGECGTVTYLPKGAATETLRGPPPYELDEWDAFQAQPAAASADDSVIQVSIQGESARTITLTGIRFSAARQRRQRGATFGAACGDPLVGRGMLVDVETDPPQIVSSSDELEGHIEAGVNETPTSPITFPWTVSVTDPLLLRVAATARACDCRWKAEIPWVSGAEKGTIHVDDGGRGFRVVGGEGLPGYVPGGGEWARLR